MSSGAAPFHDALLACIPRMRAYALAMTRCGDLADDVVQDAILIACRHRESLRDPALLRPWLFTILRNVHRARRRSRRFEALADVEQLVAEPSGDACQDTAVELSEVLDALGELPSEQREAIVLICIDELTYDEAAVVVGCAVGTLKSRVSKARSRLRQWAAGGRELPGPSVPFDGLLARVDGHRCARRTSITAAVLNGNSSR